MESRSYDYDLTNDHINQLKILWCKNDENLEVVDKNLPCSLTLLPRKFYCNIIVMFIIYFIRKRCSWSISRSLVTYSGLSTFLYTFLINVNFLNVTKAVAKLQASVKNQGHTSSLSMFTRFMFHFSKRWIQSHWQKNKKKLKWQTLLSLQSCRFWANIKLYYTSFLWFLSIIEGLYIAKHLLKTSRYFF